MSRIVFMIFIALFCGVSFTGCDSNSESESDEVIKLSNGRTLHLDNLQWLKKLIDLSKNDKDGTYWGNIWLENFKGQDIFVTNMMLGSGGVLYYFFDSSGATIIDKDYVKVHNPFIEAFAGKDYAFVEEDGEDFLNSFILKMKLKIVVYSSY